MTDIPPHLQQAMDTVKEFEATMLQLAEDLKYPVDHNGNILDMNHLPDVPHTLATHLTKRGWRHHPEKALIKARKVVGAGYYQDLVTYVPVDDSDEPVAYPPREREELWSVRPTVNVIDEKRPIMGDDQ